MVIDITGIELTPGNGGKDCLGNGEHFHKDGRPIECCCDECDYMICCVIMKDLEKCISCNDPFCPRSNRSCPYTLPTPDPDKSRL